MGTNYPPGTYSRNAGYKELDRLQAKYTTDGYSLLYNHGDSIALWKGEDQSLGRRTMKFSLERTKLFFFRIRQEYEINEKSRY